MAAYLQFFQLSQRPFTGTAHRRSAVATPPIRQTAEQVHRLLADEWPVLCVTGSAGIGKTHLALAMGGLIGDGVHWVRVESGLAWNDIAAAACKTLGVSDDGLNAAELSVIRGRGKRIVFLIDHAERLSDECLANLEALVLQKLPSDEQIVQCVLFARCPGGSHHGRGLHAWLEHLGAPEIDFDPLPCDAVSTYIERHLSWAGHDGSEIFTRDAVEFLHAITGGIPEVLSRQCERLLEEAAAAGIRQIDRTFAARVFGRGDLAGTPPAPGVASPKTELDVQPEIGADVEGDAAESADAGNLLNDLADGFLERLDAWEPGQPEPSPSIQPAPATPAAQAPVETAAVAETSAVAEAAPVLAPAPRRRLVGLMTAAAAVVIVAVGIGIWQSGMLESEARGATDSPETRSELAAAPASPPASIALDASQPVDSLVGETAVLEPASPTAEPLIPEPSAIAAELEADSVVLAQETETIPLSAEVEVEAAPEPKAEVVTAITVDVRMRRRNPLSVERTARDYEANF